MNTIGKILVILNFVFAVMVGVLMVFTFAMRTKWQDVYKAQVDENKVMKISRDETQKANAKVLTDYNTKQYENDQLRQQLKEKDDDRRALEAAHKIEKEEDLLKIAAATMTVKATLGNNLRLVKEIEELTKSIKDREVLVVKLEADAKMYRISAVSNETLARTMQTRNEQLLEEVTNLNRKLASLQAGVNPDVAVIRNPNAPNPPGVKVKGQIVRVDATENTLIEISLGTDQGVNKNNTLDVYRINPEAKYLGMIRIVEAYHNSSVARLVPTSNGAREKLRQGDQVASSLTK
jgi:hypothetical protein